ncbi:MAG TPA: hypothetical protein VGF87_10180 [Acidimicrobiales bacterium]|jgi:hypothetical protein
MARLVALHIADPPSLWHDLGFDVTGDHCTIDGVDHQLGAAGTGVVGWTLSDLDTAVFEEVPTRLEPDAPAAAPPTSAPNGVTRLDHVVVTTPDLARTIAAFECATIELRRTRVATPEMTQAFFRLGPVIIEVVGHPDRREEGPASIWGLTYVVGDLDATAASLGSHLRPPRAAVQSGRRIATLDRAAGSSVAIAFMTERPPRPDPT